MPDQKIDEINAFRKLVADLDGSGCVVVADAIHCKPKSAQAVIEAEADYLLAVKGNQQSLEESLETYFQNEETQSHQTIEKNGGRFEKRTAYVSLVFDWLEQKEKWVNLSSIGAIHREIDVKGEKTSEWLLYFK